MSGLIVERSTPLILLQDAGRFGVRHLGVTQGGALDWLSMGLANRLLGNPAGTAVIEIALGGLVLTSQRDGVLALAGADLAATLDGEPLSPGSSFAVRRGQRLVFAQPRSGARAYLAAPGGFQAPQVLGSRATVVREELGGLDGSGRALKAGDRLDWTGEPPAPRTLDKHELTMLPSASAALDVVLGAQAGDFAGQSLFDVFNEEWEVDSRADRMGVRLLGTPLRCLRDGMVSEGIPLGAIQVPPDGQPIILLNDRQTIGGYPRLGALTPLSVARLAQCLPGEKLRLRPVDVLAAQRAHRRVLQCLA